jgi:beta-lysine N6-acetyltransferase
MLSGGNSMEISEVVESSEVDVVEDIAGATVQHGELSDRVYLMKLPNSVSAKKVITAIEELARDHDYGKIFVKTASTTCRSFHEEGYEVEASVPGFYHGREDALFMVKYLDDKRKELERPEVLKEVIELSQEKESVGPQGLPPKHEIRELEASDATQMAKIYDEVFPTYPFPINDPKYLCEVMDDFVRSFGVFAPDGRLISLAACEMDRVAKNVEMTDFATLQDHRGQGLAHELLHHMEVAMREDEMKTAYTIARAKSFGMNMTFSKAGYDFGGMLKNNTNISGSIESMNVWYKPL